VDDTPVALVIDSVMRPVGSGVDVVAAVVVGAPVVVGDVVVVGAAVVVDVVVDVVVVGSSQSRSLILSNFMV
jgi:hypothetical protein